MDGFIGSFAAKTELGLVVGEYLCYSKALATAAAVVAEKPHNPTISTSGSISRDEERLGNDRAGRPS